MNASNSLYPPELDNLLRRFRLTLSLLIAGLVVSGLAYFALLRETTLVLHSRLLQGTGLLETPFGPWLNEVHRVLAQQASQAPVLFYATDWLGFAHLVMALALVGPLRHPVRNRWVIDFGLSACLGVPLMALFAGSIRGVPMYWQLVDCTFGLAGAATLLLCRHYLGLMERLRLSDARQRRHRMKRRRTQRLPRTGALG